MKILVTGFDPFGGESFNVAYEAVKALPSEIAGADIIKLEIPTVFGEGWKKVEEGIIAHDPDVILNVGQAGGRSAISVEKIGINYVEARIPDNSGNQPLNKKLDESGDTAYFATIPVKAIVGAIQAAGIPAFESYTAGTYVCNDVMYNVSRLLATKYSGKRSGFIHVPYEASQVVGKPNGTPYMTKDMIAEALFIAIKTIAEGKTDEDANVTGGIVS
jgi:pyroglutamyl-peptidase